MRIARALLAPLVVAGGLLLPTLPSRADAPPGRYSIGGGTVLDTKTGLRWQPAFAPGPYTWTAALAYCKALSLGGYSSGWRLPSMKELRTLVDESTYNPAIDATAFPGIAATDSPVRPGTFFWTSTPVATFPITAWYVNFYDGSPGHGIINAKGVAGNSYAVRCVR